MTVTRNIWLGLLVSFFVANAAIRPSLAQTISYADAIDRLAASCGNDIQKYCKGVNLGNGRIQACLNQNPSVSGQCKARLVEVAALVQKRAEVQANVAKICDTDIRRLCPGMQMGDGNILECVLKAQKVTSPKCNQAVTDAGYR